MDYKFIANLDPKIYDQFVQQYSGVSFMQDRGWATVKNNWGSILCGVYQDQQLVAACLILVRTFTRRIKMFYIPRGYLCDFTNQKLLAYFTSEIKNLARHHHAYVVKLDPSFCVSEKTWKELQTKEKEKTPIFFSENYEIKHQNLLNLGYHHKGFYQTINAAFQPRYQMVCPLIDSHFKRLTIDEVTKQYKSKVRYYLGDFHEKRGVHFEITEDENRLSDFIKILNYTEKRQNIELRNEEYFKRIMHSYRGCAKLLFGYIYMDEYISYLKETKAKGLEEAIQLQKENGNQLLMSASLVLLPSNQTGIRVSEYLYAGNNLLYPNLRISTGMVYEILKLSIHEHCDYCNLGGVEGTLDDHLTEFKSKFNPIVWEYAGEYDLPIQKTIYSIILHGEQPLKKGYHFISKILKK